MPERAWRFESSRRHHTQGDGLGVGEGVVWGLGEGVGLVSRVGVGVGVLVSVGRAEGCAAGAWEGPVGDAGVVPDPLRRERLSELTAADRLGTTPGSLAVGAPASTGGGAGGASTVPSVGCGEMGAGAAAEGSSMTPGTALETSVKTSSSSARTPRKASAPTTVRMHEASAAADAPLRQAGLRGSLVASAFLARTITSSFVIQCSIGLEPSYAARRWRESG